jgi:GT2 family glycosyltransferase/glycosyltransferase involved in cell wall biosynthesis
MSAIYRRFGPLLQRSSDPERVFDAHWYVKRYPEVAGQKSPLQHYIERGAVAGLQPHPLFDSARYLRLNQDVAAAGINPLVHYLRFGWREGRSPHPLFDDKWYLSNYPNVAKRGINPLIDFIEVGAAKGRQPHPLFDSAWYVKNYPELQLKPAEAVLHYLEIGGLEGRKPCPFFDGAWYLATYPEVQRAGLNPLVHYIEFGSKEGRLPHPLFDPNWYLNRPPEGTKGATEAFFQFVDSARDAGYHSAPSWFLANAFDQQCADRVAGYFLKYGLSSSGARRAVAPTRQEIESWVDEIKRLEPSAPPLNPDVSIVVPVFNELAHTLACIHSLLEMKSSHSFEIIVGDDASTDETASVMKRLSSVRHVRGETNRGFIANCNAAAATARGRYVNFLNNDTIVLPGWLDELVGTLERDPSIGLVGSKLIFSDGRLQEAGGIIWRDGSAWNYGRGQDPHRPEFSYLRSVDYVSGASIMLPTSLWQELGGFDDWYEIAYGEDSDLAFRVRQHGRRVVMQPLSMLLHFEGVTSGTDTSSGAKAYQISNARKLFERWKPVLEKHRPPGESPALERERDVKQRLLVIDAITPTPDEDAGSLTCFEIMRAFQANGFKVNFLPWTNLLFARKHTKALQRIGIEAIYQPYYTSHEEYLKQNGSLFDIILLFRNEVSFRAIDMIARHAPNAKIIFHVSDLHFVREARQAALEGSDHRRARHTQAREIYSVIASDLTIVHSDYEKEILEKATPGAAVYVFPWIVDTKPAEKGFDERAGIGFLGGYGHPPNIDAVLYFVEAIWPKIHAARPDIMFYVYGSRAPQELLELDGKMNIRVIGYLEDLKDCFDNIRVSIAPLRYGAGLKGKVAMAMSYGVPVVGTSCAAEGMMLKNGENILIRDNEDDFAKAVLQIYDDKELWTRMSAASLSYIEEGYSTNKGVARVREIIDMVLNEDTPREASNKP